MVPDGMQAMNDATVNALSTGSDPKEAKCAKDVQAAEKTAAESLAAAASAADAVGGAAAKASLDVVTLGATAQAAADKAKADRASAHAARKALADALEPAADPSGGKNARLAEVSKKLQDLAAEMQTQIRGETDLSKVFPVADTANAATGLVAAACAKVETK
jgi:hypothetical protein